MQESELRDVIAQTLEGIFDPCSLASGAPAGLVSMGLVGPISIKQTAETAESDIEVTLFVTEPGCMMSALFQVTAAEKLKRLESVSSVRVHVDHGHIWDPSQMTLEYRERLKAYRSCQSRHAKSERLKQG
jgi:metal-sulfur cluster biosynthetic enzyme